MDVYDPQMPDVMACGGLMVVLAIGIFLLFSFMEKVLLPSEEALAKQGKYIKKTEQQKKEAKKKAVMKAAASKRREPALPLARALPTPPLSSPAPADSDGPLYLPYKTLVSTVSSTVFSEGEAQRLIEILREKAGIVQDTWHTAMQKGGPVAVLERQLEEKEKQLATEQEAAAAARNKRRELSKELVAERAKVTAVEGKLKEQLLACEQELELRLARMQASYKDHVEKTQQLQDKIRTLQEQLENRPNTQLARLQQENSILRDALYQTSSWLESKHSPELARLREEYAKLMNELSEKSKLLQQEEWQRKSLELKAAALQKEVEQLQVRQALANLLPSERWGGWLNCVGSVGLAMGRARGEMSVRIWKASCLADLFIACCPLSVCHMQRALLRIPGKAQGARCPGGSRSRSPVKLTSRL
ncbi:ribosome-binding protein 1-like [Falco naumanni]|uniref:ribosome-binding protein 1-like n=1 Tax=Falco naumanni TaxID=148594 RepID=UPI001ADE0913|nr:ribosome-binding protein 1-like [Falco naumanni]